MATRDASMVVRNDRVLVVTWEGLESGDDGTEVVMAAYPDRTVQVVGAFDSGDVTLQGSNDGTNWAALVDHIGNPIALSDSSLVLIAQCPLFIRPLAANGGGSMDVDVIVVGCPRY